jgi:hypothetical protein
MMLKQASHKYTAGKRCDGSVKLKFWRSLEAVVTARHIDGKENAELALIDPDHGEVNVGSISCLGHEQVAVGDVVECKYLYAVDPRKPKLYQPNILRVRTDKPADECTVDQLVYTNKRVVPSVEVFDD